MAIPLLSLSSRLIYTCTCCWENGSRAYYVNISTVIYGKEFDVTKIEVCKNKATTDMLHVLNHPSIKLL